MKKNNTLLSVILLLAFTIKLKFAIAKDVQDVDSNVINISGFYYILPSGVTVGSIGASEPRAIVQSPSSKSLGLKVSFSTLNNTSVINTDDLVSISFGENISGCKDPSNWVLVNDASAKVWYVGITCAGNKPGNQIKKGTFQIQEFNSAYKFAFCSATSPKSCQDVGIYVDSAKNRRLAIGSGISTFPVKFKQAKF